MKHALFFADGEVTENQFRKIDPRSFEVIIAADGGAAHALKGGFQPDYVVGDLDSLTPVLKKELKQAQFIHRPSQESNDLEKGLEFCRELGVEEITLLGIAGKRLDHTLNNLSVLCRFDQIFSFSIYDSYSQIFIVRDAWEYQGDIRQLISLIPMGEVAGVVTQGLAYPLNDEPLIFGQREGLSNYIVSTPVRVQIQKGILLIFALDT